MTTTDDPNRTLTCPTSTHTPEGEPHTIIGCGSSDVIADEDEPGLFDCNACGIWFFPAREGSTL